MKVYNKDKTKLLLEYDLEKGYLKDEKLFIKKEPAKIEIKEKSHEVVIVQYPNGGKDVEVVIDTPYQPAEPEKEIYEDIKVYIPYTESELQKRMAFKEYNGSLKWFDWYDIQLLQALRAERTNTEWTANDGNKEYKTLEELDLEANNRQEIIRKAKVFLSK